MTKYYISLDSKNLSSHFTNGYISPQKYQKDERGNSSAHNDVQSIYAEHLLVTNFLYSDASNCALEIVFTEAEKYELIKIGNDDGSLFLFEKALPLSRVKKVNFKDAEQQKRTVANINKGSAFIRDSLLNVQNEDSITVNAILESSKASGKVEVNTITNEDMLENYSRLLSAFSLMRLVTPADNEYPSEYIELFSQVSKEVASNGSSMKVNIHDQEIFNNILKITKDPVKDQNIPINNAGLYDLEKIKKDDKSFPKAFLLKYGNESNARQKIDDFIDHVVNQKKGLNELPSTLALYLGYREKYSSLRNKYAIGDIDVSVKFKLDSKFDYYLLESLYQFVFNSIEQSGKFTYLDDWVPEFVNIDSFEGYESEFVLGKRIKGKKKQTPLEYLQRFSPDFLQNFSKIYKVIYLSCTAEMDQSDEKAKKRISFFTDKLEGHFLELLNNFTQKVDDKLQEDCNKTLNQKEMEITELKRKLAEKESQITDLEKLAESDKRVVGISPVQKEDYKIVENPNDIVNNVSTVTANIPDTSTEETVYSNKNVQVELSRNHGDEYAGIEQSTTYYDEYAGIDQSTTYDDELSRNSRSSINVQAALLLKNKGNTYSEEDFRKKLKNRNKDILIACINQLQESNPTLNDIDTSAMKKDQLIDYIVNVSPDSD
jgi:hypothetical protein